MKRSLLAAAAVMSVACGARSPDGDSDTSAEELKLPPALVDSDFPSPLTRESIRALQTWIDDATFEVVGPDVPGTNTMAPSADPTHVAQQRAMYSAAPLGPSNLDFERVP